MCAVFCCVVPSLCVWSPLVASFFVCSVFVTERGSIFGRRILYQCSDEGSFLRQWQIIWHLENVARSWQVSAHVKRYTSHTPYLNACSCSQFVCTGLHSALTLHAWLKLKIALHSKKCRSISRAMSHAMPHGTRSTSSS